MSEADEATPPAAGDLERAKRLVDRPNDVLRRVKDRIDARLNDHLCEMQEGYDDSIVGFNEAWDIVRAIFAEI